MTSRYNRPIRNAYSLILRIRAVLFHRKSCYVLPHDPDHAYAKPGAPRPTRLRRDPNTTSQRRENRMASEPEPTPAPPAPPPVPGGSFLDKINPHTLKILVGAGAVGLIPCFLPLMPG